jgi:peptidoglycan/LPS O-acetylase OafA/YrhL
MKQRLLLLDINRWILATYVIFFHFWSWTKDDTFWQQKVLISSILHFGYLSVDIFFIISGFAISSSIAGKTPKTYVVARLKRLVPTFVFVSLFETAITIFLHFRHSWRGNIFAIFLTGGQNLLPISGNSASLRNFVAWSLSVEIQFYVIILVGFLFFFFKELIFHKYQLELMRLLMASLYLFGYISTKQDLSLPILIYLPYFILGSFLWQLGSGDISKKSIRFLDFIVLIPLLCRTISIRLANAPIPNETIYGASILCVFILFITLASLIKTSRFCTFGKYIGSASYALYLIGGFLGVQLFVHLKDSLGIVSAAIFSYLICVTISIIYQLYLDKPFQKFIFRQFSQKIDLA